MDEHGTRENGPLFKSGFVALIGRPNSGKSTLVNAVMGTKVAITSDTPQTTRHRLRAIVDTDAAQVVLIDTPGLHKPQDALGEELNRSSLAALSDVDVACLLIDSTAAVGAGDRWVAAHVLASSAPVKLLVLTKADLADAAKIPSQLSQARGLGSFDDEIVVSALTGFNIDGFLTVVTSYLPPGPRYFPADMATDQPLEVMVAEFIREKILRSTFDEIPHAVGVSVEGMSFDQQADLARVQALVYVERESQKGIIVGRGGEMIKRIGTEARKDLERLLGSSVYLDLMVKVRQNWRRDASQVRRFGYGEGL